MKTESGAAIADIYLFLKDLITEHLVNIEATLIKNNTNWRLHSQFFEELAKLYPDLHFCFRTMLFKTFEQRIYQELKTGIEPVRKSLANLLSTILYYCHSNLLRNEIFDVLAKELAVSKACSHRKTYMDFCANFIPVCSSKRVKEHLLKPLLNMRLHKSPTIRIKYATDIVPVLN